MHLCRVAFYINNGGGRFVRKHQFVVDFEFWKCFHGQVENVDISVIHTDEEVRVVKGLWGPELGNIQAGDAIWAVCRWDFDLDLTVV